MLDLLNRKSLMGSLPHGGVGAEIGVQDGNFSEVILAANQPRELWLVDCWQHQDKSEYGSDPVNVAQSEQEQRFQAVTKRFADRPHVKILREWSAEAAATFPDAYFDWWYLDANHLQAAKDIVAWWPKLKSGGWATGHDFCVASDFIRVKPDVEAFAAKHGLKIHVAGLHINAPGQGYPSWAIQKP